VVALLLGFGLATDRSRVQIPAGLFSCDIGQLSLASIWVAKSSTCFGWGKGDGKAIESYDQVIKIGDAKLLPT